MKLKVVFVGGKSLEFSTSEWIFEVLKNRLILQSKGEKIRILSIPFDNLEFFSLEE